MRVAPIVTSYGLKASKLNFGKISYAKDRQTEYDITAIGSATRDNFYTTKESVILYHNGKPYLSYPLGAKLEATSQTEMGGGAVNTAINLKNLGLATAVITKVGKDPKGKQLKKLLERSGIKTEGLIMEKDGKTASSVILKHEYTDDKEKRKKPFLSLLFPSAPKIKLDDRTVLADRGVGSAMRADEINKDVIKKSDWILIAPLNGESAGALEPTAVYAEENGVRMAMIMGKASIAKGFDSLVPTLDTAEIVVMNREEASDLTKIKIKSDDTSEIPKDVKDMFAKIKTTKAEVVVITDGSKGAYAYDGEKYYKSPIFPPVEVVNTLGAGDAFASTFTASMIKTEGDIEKSLAYAAVNSSAVVEQFGAHDGILTFEQMDEKLSASDFKIKQIAAA